MRKRSGAASLGFTLIELLIVIAIIAILALIAIPNFLEAQTRSKIARVKADMRSAGTALEAYYVDYNAYPQRSNPSRDLQFVYQLTTPVAFVSSVRFIEPFAPMNTGLRQPCLRYFFYKDSYWIADNDMFGKDAWAVLSYGPDRDEDGLEHYPILSGSNPNYNGPTWLATKTNMVYDPTNGTISNGDIARYGGQVTCGASPN